MKWLTRESFSERRFNGWWKWGKDLVSLAWLAGFASQLAAARNGAVLFDITSVVLLWPMITLGCVLLLAWACKRVWHVSFPAALEGLEMYLPIILLVPVLEIIGDEAGLRTQIDFVGTKEALGSLVTGGLFPVVAPPAVTCLWIGALIWIMYAWWRSSSEQSAIFLARAIAPTYILFGCLPLIPSMIGWTLLAGNVPLWNAPSALVQQAFTAAQIDGFSWRAIYERFPLALRGEAYVSTQWFFLSLGLITFVMLMGVYLMHGQRIVWGRFWESMTILRVRRAYLRSITGTVALGAVLALLLETTPVWGWTHVLAACVLAATILLIILAASGHKDLSEAAEGSLPSNRPLALGEVRASDLQDWTQIWLAGSLVGAWLLGWPVFLAYILALVADREALESQSHWAKLGFQGVSHIGYVLVGWMTIVERGSFGALAPAIALLIALAILVFQRFSPLSTSR